MTDERRAEIEAVRPFIVGALREARAAISATPAATRENARALRLVDDALGRLDRVRDARGDDEAKKRRPRVPAPSGRPGSLTPPAARSPQDEDHEAGIEAATRILFAFTTPGHRQAVGEAVAAYLARAFPSRDGTVAEVERLRRGIGRIAYRMHLMVGDRDEDIERIVEHIDASVDFPAPNASPDWKPRDGTVAVEDVVEALREAATTLHNIHKGSAGASMAACSRSDCRARAALLAAFSPASTGDRPLSE
jgi:hypothetical protein